MRMTRNALKLSVASLALMLLSGTANADFDYAEAAKPYAGTSIRILDEVTPLQEVLAKLVPKFTEETGINVQYELLSHLDVINKGQADMLSRNGMYDAVMLHSFQLGPLLDAQTILPIDELLANSALGNADLDQDDFIQQPFQTMSFFGGKQYGFINWNYNMVYWTRGDLLNDEGEKAAFKEKYGYDLAPAATLEQLRDIAEFFTRKSGETLKGEPLSSDFYGVVLEGLKGQTGVSLYIGNVLRNFGGDIVDENGKPSFNTPEVVESLKLWAELWKFSPPGTAEYSVIDVPTVMGNGIAAQTIAFSDFVLGIDKPGASPLHGQFVYAPPPVKAGADPKFAAAEGEPSMIVISQASKNPEATFLFLQWLVEKRQQANLLEAGNGGVPIRTSSWPGLSKLAETNPTLVAAMQGSLERVKAKAPMPNYFQIVDALSDIVQQVGLGSIAPEDAAVQGQQALERLCNDNCLLTN